MMGFAPLYPSYKDYDTPFLGTDPPRYVVLAMTVYLILVGLTGSDWPSIASSTAG